MLNGKLENSFISGQDKETLRRTRTERQNYEELSKEFRERIVKDLNTKELQSLSKNSSASLTSIQAMMKVQGSYLRNIDNTLKRLVKINDNFIKALTKNLSLGTKINLGNKASILGSYATDNRKNIIRDNKEYANLSSSISTFTDVIKKLDERQRERTNEVLSMLSEVPTDLSTNISIAIDKTLRDHPMLRKVYGTLSATAGTAFNWTKQGISEMLGLPTNISLGNLTKIVSWNVTGKWEREVRINKSLPLQTLISLLSSIQKQTWLINNDTLQNIQNGYKSSTKELEDKGGLKTLADSISPGLKKMFLTYLGLKAGTNGWLPFLKLDNAAFWLSKKILFPVVGFLGNIGVSLLTILGKGAINYPKITTGFVSVGALLLNRAKTNAKRLADNEKKLNKMRSEAQGNWYNPDYETIKVGGKTLSEKDRSKSWAGYIKEEFSKGFWRETFTKGFGKTVGGLWKSIFNQDALRKEREANDKEAELKAIESFKIKFMTSIAKRGQDVADAIIGLKEAEYDIKLMREQVVGKSNFKEIEEAKKLIADLKAQQQHAEDTKIEANWWGRFFTKQWWSDWSGTKSAYNWTKDKLSNTKTSVVDFYNNAKEPLWWMSQGDKLKDWYNTTFTKDNFKNTGKNGLDKVRNFLTDNRVSNLIVDWFKEFTEGKDEGKGIRDLIGGTTGANSSNLGWLRLAKNRLALLRTGKDEKGNNIKGDNLYKGLKNANNSKGISDILNQLDPDEQKSFAFLLLSRIGYQKGNTLESRIQDLKDQLWVNKDGKSFASRVIKELQNINNQFYYNKTGEKTFATMLFDKLGKVGDKSLIQLTREIHDDVCTSQEGKGTTPTLKYIIRGGLDPITKKDFRQYLPEPSIHLYERFDKWLEKEGIDNIQSQARGTMQYYTSGNMIYGNQANQQLSNAAKGKGNQGTVSNIFKALNETNNGSLFYKMAVDIHAIAALLRDQFKPTKTKSGKTNSVINLSDGQFDGIPYFATGAKVDGPTLAMVGEAGPEKVQPLTGPVAEEVHKQEAKGIFGYLKDYFSSVSERSKEYQEKYKYNKIAAGANVISKDIAHYLWEDAKQTGKDAVNAAISGTKIAGVAAGAGIVGTVALTAAAISKAPDAVRAAKKFMDEANTVGVYSDRSESLRRENEFADEGLSGNFLSNIDKFADAKKKIQEERIAKVISDTINEYEQQNGFGKRVKTVLTDYITNPIKNYFDDTIAKGKTKAGKVLHGISSYLKNDLETFKKRFKSKYLPFFKDPIGVLLGSASEPAHLSLLTNLISRAIFPVIGIGLIWLLMNPRMKSATKKFVTGIIPNYLRYGFWGGTSRNIVNALEMLPGNEEYFGSESKLDRLGYLAGKGAGKAGLAAGYQLVAKRLGKSTGKALSKLGLKSFAKTIPFSSLLWDVSEYGLSKYREATAKTIEEKEKYARDVRTDSGRLKSTAIGTALGAGIGALGLGVGAAPGAAIGGTIGSVGYDIYNAFSDTNEYVSDDVFLKEKAKRYGFTQLDLLTKDQKKLLKTYILQLETSSFVKTLSPTQLEQLKYTIARLGNSKFIVSKQDWLGNWSYDEGDFAASFVNSEQYKYLERDLGFWKNKHANQKIFFGLGISKTGRLCTGNPRTEMMLMSQWVNESGNEEVIVAWRGLPPDTQAKYLKEWCRWQYGVDAAQFKDEDGNKILNDILNEYNSLQRKKETNVETAAKRVVTPTKKKGFKHSLGYLNAKGEIVDKLDNVTSSDIISQNFQPLSSVPSDIAERIKTAAKIQTDIMGANRDYALKKRNELKAKQKKLEDQGLHVEAGRIKDELEKKMHDDEGFYCARGVGNTLAKAGLLSKHPGGHAWTYANTLSKSKNFIETTKDYKEDPKELLGAPLGSVIVWGKSKERPNGHVAIVVGKDTKGNVIESSDRQSLLAKTIERANQYSGFRVFYPNVNNQPKQSSSLFSGLKDLYNTGAEKFSNFVGNTKTTLNKMATSVSSAIDPKSDMAKNVYEKAWDKAVQESKSLTYGSLSSDDIYNNIGWGQLFMGGTGSKESRRVAYENMLNKVKDIYEKQYVPEYGYLDKDYVAWQDMTKDLDPKSKAFANEFFGKLGVERKNSINEDALKLTKSLVNAFDETKNTATETIEVTKEGFQATVTNLKDGIDKIEKTVSENKELKELVNGVKEIAKKLPDANQVKDSTVKVYNNNIQPVVNSTASYIDNSLSHMPSFDVGSGTADLNIFD
jgi:hypothetical protein